MKKIYIFGHKRPDTDSICSTIAYTNLKKALGFDNVQAYRLDKVNKETKFILDYFNVEEPKLLPDLELKVKDLNLYNPKKISSNDAVKKAWDLLLETKGSRIIPCVDETEELQGIISVGDLTNLLMDTSDEELTEKYEIIFENFIEVIEAEVLREGYKYHRVEGQIIISSKDASDSITNKDILITSRVEFAKEYLEKTNCGCVIVTNDKDISELETIESSCAIYKVKTDLYNVITNIKKAVSVYSVMQKDELVVISSSAYLDDAIKQLQTSAHRNFPVVGKRGQFVGILSRRHLIDYERKQAILIDHNERNQSVDGINNAEILEIIDHHRVADVQTDSPILIRSEPVGCTSTIIYKMYRENNVPIPRTMAGLMMSAIISDTLKFSSPTCTAEDVNAARALSTVCEIDIDEFAVNMFKAGTSIKDLTFDELLNMDTKVFNIADSVVYISQINTLDLDDVDARRDEYMASMDKFCEQTMCSLLILMVTDIINGGSKIIPYGKMTMLAEKAFHIPNDQSSIYLEGVVSRKKQIVPRLIMASRDI